MEMNPIFRRESRVLWRGDRPFVLLLLYALALSVLMVSLYASNRLGGARFEARIATDGALVFRTLAYSMLGIWLLVVPVTAAPLLALEREHGLLEALQLSGVASWRIVMGKFANVLSFSLLLWAAGAPPLAISFYMGGVSPQEWIGVCALQLVTIVTGAALGLFVSSRARRVQTALRDTLLLVASWMLLSHFSNSFAVFFLGLFGWTSQYGYVTNSIATTVAYFFYADPFSALHAILQMPSGTPVGSNTYLDAQFLPIHLRLHLGATLFFLWRATVNAGQALPEAQWVERRRYLTLRRGRIKSAPVVMPGNDEQTERSVWDVPLVTLLRFRNPVLQREVRGLFRLRRFSLLINILLALIITVLAVAYALALLFVWGYPASRFAIWQYLMWMLLLGVFIAAPLRGANAIARERENGTWENLRLSRLEPRTILWGKVLAPLVFLSCLFLLIAPIWLACIIWPDAGRDARFIVGLDAAPGVWLPYALAGAALLYALAFGLTSWGLWISWHCRSAASATGWTLGTIYIGIFGLSYLPYSLVHFGAYWLGWLYVTVNSVFLGVTIKHSPDAYYSYSGFGSYSHLTGLVSDFRWFLHPLREMSQLISVASYYSSVSGSYSPTVIPQPIHAFVAAGVQTVTGALLLLDVQRRMKKSRFLEQELAESRGRKAKTPV